MERVAKPLRQMGAEVHTRDGTPPVDIKAAERLHGIDYLLPVASAQVKSAILLAGLYAEGRHQGDRAGGQPRPHRAHAESFGVRLEGDEHGRLRASAAAAAEPAPARCRADFSSAAFFIVAGASRRERWCC